MEEKRDKIEELVWYELIHAKYWEQYISDYTGSKMDWRKFYNIIAISFAIIGGSTWGAWKALDVEWVTPVMFGLMGIAQILSAIQKNVIIDNETIQSLTKLRTSYISYFNKLERLFIKIEDNQLDKFQIEEEYFSLRETVYPIEELKDTLNISKLKTIDKKVEGRVIDYLKSRYDI
jgi:hypothetical protein